MAARIQEQITPLGFGSAAIGNLYRSSSDEVAAATVRAALAASALYGGTAPHGGFRLSESALALPR